MLDPTGVTTDEPTAIVLFPRLKVDPSAGVDTIVQLTNTSGKDDVHTEGNVIAVERPDGADYLLVTLALGRNETVVVQVFCSGSGSAAFHSVSWGMAATPRMRRCSWRARNRGLSPAPRSLSMAE